MSRLSNYATITLICVIFIDKVCGKVSPLCNVCKCLEKPAGTLFDCSESATNYNYTLTTEIYKPENYADITENRTVYYEINVFNFSGMPIEYINESLPTSTLKVLDFSNADLLDICNAAFMNLQNMTELNLGKNHISSLSPDTFKGLRVNGSDYPLKALKILRLNDNNMHSIHNDAFQHIEETLEELYLQGNPFKIIDLSTLQAIHGIIKLRVLDLSNTQISSLPQHFLHTPGNLEEFYLADNEFTNVTCLELDMAHKLKKLVISENPIVNITEKDAFPSVPTLEILHMCEMPDLELIGNHSMCNLKGLKELYVSNNPKLRTIEENALVRVEEGSEVPVIQSLTKLFIGTNAITRLKMTLDWTKLGDLDINDNPWTCECENQWMLDTLMPIYCKINEARCKSLKCAAPVEMEDFTFHSLAERKYDMRCLDAYGHHPESDGIILVCFMLGLLIGIVVILLGVYAWKRHWFGAFDNSPAAFSRQFYGRTSSHDDSLG